MKLILHPVNAFKSHHKEKPDPNDIIISDESSSSSNSTLSSSPESEHRIIFDQTNMSLAAKQLEKEMTDIISDLTNGLKEKISKTEPAINTFEDQDHFMAWMSDLELPTNLGHLLHNNWEKFRTVIGLENVEQMSVTVKHQYIMNQIDNLRSQLTSPFVKLLEQQEKKLATASNNDTLYASHILKIIHEYRLELININKEQQFESLYRFANKGNIDSQEGLSVCPTGIAINIETELTCIKDSIHHNEHNLPEQLDKIRRGLIDKVTHRHIEYLKDADKIHIDIQTHIKLYINRLAQKSFFYSEHKAADQQWKDSYDDNPTITGFTSEAAIQAKHSLFFEYSIDTIASHITGEVIHKISSIFTKGQLPTAEEITRVETLLSTFCFYDSDGDDEKNVSEIITHDDEYKYTGLRAEFNIKLQQRIKNHYLVNQGIALEISNDRIHTLLTKTENYISLMRCVHELQIPVSSFSLATSEQSIHAIGTVITHIDPLIQRATTHPTSTTDTCPLHDMAAFIRSQKKRKLTSPDSTRQSVFKQIKTTPEAIQPQHGLASSVH